jgi:hypothetical protein
VSAATRHASHATTAKEHFDLPIAATLTLRAEVAVDRIPELLGETADHGPSESGWHRSGFCIPSRFLVLGAVERGPFMPRRKSIVTVIRELVQEEVGTAINSLLGTGKPKAKNGRRRRRRRTRGTWRPGGPGRPPKAVAQKMARKKGAAAKRNSKMKVIRRRRRRRGPGRSAGSKTKAA